MTFGLVAGMAREVQARRAGQASGARRLRRPAPRRAVLVPMLAGLAVLAAGCGSAPKPVITTVAGSIEASPKLNPSVNQRPSPLLLRIYELRTVAGFNNADFMALYQSDQATLAADLVAREEFMLQPGESRPYRKTLGADTRFIGVLGAYRNLERATWRAVVPVQPGKAQTLTIRAGDLAVSADVKP